MNDALSIFASRFTPPGWKTGEAVSFCTPSLTGAADAFLALTLTLGETPSSKTNARPEPKDRVILAITPGLPDADRLADDLRILSSGSKQSATYPVRILEFPPKLGGDKSALGTRLKTIAALKAWS